MNYVIAPPEQASVAVTGSDQRFPVHRIYCVGRNYAEHAREMGSSGREAPFFFMKPADAVLPAAGTGTTVMPYPTLTGDLHHEIELVAALGRGGRDIPVAEAAAHIWGFAVGLDMTRRDLQADAKKLGRPWCIAKGFDASAPIAPITPVADAGDVAGASIWLKVNGEPRQSGRIDQMIWNLAEIVSHLSRAWALQPGDLIFTGTPAGVGPVARGDVLEGGVTGLAPLHVRVA